MRKIHALIITSLLTLVLLGNWIFFTQGKADGENVIIEEVKDGDTVLLRDGRSVRLLNINAPEKGRPHESQATEYLEQYINNTLTLQPQGLGSFGRVLGVFYHDGLNLNLDMVRKGLVHTYLVQKNDEEIYGQSEEEARIKEIGIWEKAENYGCIIAEINKKEEYVEIQDGCGQSLEGWLIKDESSRSFVMPQMNYTQRLRLHSGKGTNTPHALYWGRNKIWNDDTDAIFIRDQDGKLVYFHRYGAG